MREAFHLLRVKYFRQVSEVQFLHLQNGDEMPALPSRDNSPRRAMGSIKSDQVERECLIRRLIQENGVKFNKHGNFFMKSING